MNAADADLRVPHDVDKFPTVGEPLNSRALLRLAEDSIGIVYIRGGLADSTSLVRGPFVYVPYDSIVRRGYAFDMDRMGGDNLVTRGRHLRVEAMIDGQNRRLTADALKQAFPQSLATHTSIPAPQPFFQMAAEPSSPQQLAEWFDARLRRGGNAP